MLAVKMVMVIVKMMVMVCINNCYDCFSQNHIPQTKPCEPEHMIPSLVKVVMLAVKLMVMVCINNCYNCFSQNHIPQTEPREPEHMLASLTGFFNKLL